MLINCSEVITHTYYLLTWRDTDVPETAVGSLVDHLPCAVWKPLGGDQPCRRSHGNGHQGRRGQGSAGGYPAQKANCPIQSTVWHAAAWEGEMGIVVIRNALKMRQLISNVTCFNQLF